jgi:hypothetical protein|tara:strand:- start:1839 stop:2093 length:255 start_codon:yes stop_codon:yes gene_type:complete
MEMLKGIAIASSSVFLTALLGLLGWIGTSIVDLKMDTAVIAVKVDANHQMLKPMWEEFTGRTYDGNLAQFHPKTNFKPTIKAEF